MDDASDNPPYDIPAHDQDAYAPPSNKRIQHTIASLRLNMEEALEGRTFNLLPDGFRTPACGLNYPLPTKLGELRLLALVPTRRGGTDSGCTYIKRARVRLKQKRSRLGTLSVESEGERQRMKAASKRCEQELRQQIADARAAVEQVKVQAQEAIASLNDLFSLGRKGMDEIMRGYLDGKQVKGEIIGHRSFMACFRMVTQTVGRLGLPSEQRGMAREAIMDEVAASLKDTQDSLAMAPGTDEEKPQ